MNFSRHEKSTLLTLIACLISGLISGTGDKFFRVADVSGYFIPVLGEGGWDLTPGIAFGVLFSIAHIVVNFDRYPLFYAVAYIVLYTIASSAIYYGARWIGDTAFLAIGGLSTLIGILSISIGVIIAGGSAGLFGAGALSLVTKILSRTQIKLKDETRTALVGLACGVIFLMLPPRYAGFTIWQMAVGWSLSQSLPIRQLLFEQSIVTLYKTTQGKRHYHEAWLGDNEVVEHWGSRKSWRNKSSSLAEISKQKGCLGGCVTVGPQRGIPGPADP